jgi:hypothetical protein
MSSISSVSSTPVMKPVESQQPQPQPKPADRSDDTSKTQQAKAPLPPGQGVKVDMIA